MSLTNVLLTALNTQGISNVFNDTNIIYDKKYLNENYYKIIEGKKYLNIWIIQSKGYSEKHFSLSHNLCKEEISITGILGIDKSESTIELFNNLIDDLTQKIKIISKDNVLLKMLKGIRCSNITKKYYANILCQNVDIIFEYEYLKEK